MTPNSRSEGMVSEVRTDNNNVLQFIEDTGKTEFDFIESTTAGVYSEYYEWCQSSGIRPYGKPKFSKKINDQFNLVAVVRRRSFADGSKTVRVFERKGA